MSEHKSRATSYQVSLPGEFGPAFQAAFARSGAGRVVRSSAFLVPATDETDVATIAAMLEKRGLQILEIRRVPDHPPRVRHSRSA